MRALPCTFATLVLIASVTSVAMAAAPPTGTITCTIAGEISFHPFIGDPPNGNAPNLGGTTVRATTDAVTCDTTGVVDGKLPITGLAMSLIAKMPAGSSCSTLMGAPVFNRAKLKIRWQGQNPAGRTQTIATTSASFVGASWDNGDGSLVFTSQPVKGAFAGVALTLRLTFHDAAQFAETCLHGNILGTHFGDVGPAMLALP